MSKPTLYADDTKNIAVNLLSAHEFARMNGMSIRKARRIIGKLLKAKSLRVYRKQKQ